MIGDLRGMDRELAGEAFAARGLRFGAEACLVLEVGEHAVDRLDSGGDRAGEAQRAGELVGEAELAAGVIFGRAPSAADRSSAPQLIAASGDAGSR